MLKHILRVLVGVLLLTQVPYAQRGSILSQGGDTYTIVGMLGSGNDVSPVFDTTGLTNIPMAWRSSAIKVIIGATEGMALRGYTHLNNKTGYTQRFDFYLLSDASVNETFCSIAVGKGISALPFYDENTPIAY